MNKLLQQRQTILDSATARDGGDGDGGATGDGGDGDGGATGDGGDGDGGATGDGGDGDGGATGGVQTDSHCLPSCSRHCTSVSV